MRHLTWSLPSGQSIARAMRGPALPPRQLAELRSLGVGFERSTPPWYYIQKEAELAGGAALSGVGARMVGEVFIEMLHMNSKS